MLSMHACTMLNGFGQHSCCPCLHAPCWMDWVEAVRPPVEPVAEAACQAKCGSCKSAVDSTKLGIMQHQPSLESCKITSERNWHQLESVPWLVNETTLTHLLLLRAVCEPAQMLSTGKDVDMACGMVRLASQKTAADRDYWVCHCTLDSLILRRLY